MSIKKVTQHPTQNEGLIFERSQTGRIGYRLPKLDVDETNIDSILPAELASRRRSRRRSRGVRGRCRSAFHADVDMELLDRSRHVPAWLVHDEVQFAAQRKGRADRRFHQSASARSRRRIARALELIYGLQKDLSEITGLPGVSLQPAAGAQGEMTGVMLIRAFLDERDGEASKDRRVMLIPDSAHGTNPASAAHAGFTVKTIRSTERRPDRSGAPAPALRRRRRCRTDADESEHGRHF